MAKLNAAHAAKGNAKTVKNLGGIKKNKNPKYKQTPTGKVVLINGSKAQDNNNKKQQVQNKKNNSPKKVQENSPGKENSPTGKQNSPVKKNNSSAGKINSPVEKNVSPSKINNSPARKNNSPVGKKNKRKQQSPQKQSPKSKPKNSLKKSGTEEEEESDEDYNEGITIQEELSIAGDDDFDDEEESDSEVDVPNILGASLADHTDEDDEDFKAEEVIVKQNKGVKMFKGLLKAENETENASDEEEEEPLGLKTLLGNSIVDDEDDEEYDVLADLRDSDASNSTLDSCLMSSGEHSHTDTDDENEDEEEGEDGDSSEDEDEDEDEESSAINSSTEKTEEGNKELTEEQKAEQRNRTIFVGNLPVHITKEKLQKLFKKFGAIENLRFRGAIPEKMNMPKKRAAITKKLNPNVKTMYAFIVYKSEESAKAALSMNGKKVEDHYLRVDTTTLKKPDPKKCIFLGNLPFRADVNTIWDHFKDCGEIDSVRIVRDKWSGIGKGIAYINFKTEDAVHLALNLNGSKIGNREIRVKICVPEGAEKNQKKKLKKRSHSGESKNDSPSKKMKNNHDEAVVRATQNSENAVRRKSQKEMAAQQNQNNPKDKGTFQGQKADSKKKKKENKLNKKKKIMAAKLAAKPKKPVSSK